MNISLIAIKSIWRIIRVIILAIVFILGLVQMVLAEENYLIVSSAILPTLYPNHNLGHFSFLLLSLLVGFFLLSVLAGFYIFSQFNQLQKSHKNLEEANAKLLQEIAESKRRETILRQSEAKNSSIVNAIPDTFFHLTHQGIILDFKSPNKDNNFFAISELLGKSITEVMPQEIGNSILNSVQKALNQESIPNLQFEYPAHQKIGYYEARFIAIRENEVLVIVRDITECKQSQQQLYDTQQRLQYLLYNNPAVIYSCQATDNYSATFVSPNSSSLVGYETEEFLSNPNLWMDNIHPDDFPVILTKLSQLPEEIFHIYEYRFRHKNGNYIWIHDELKLIVDEKGNPKEIIGYWIDITERKQAEAEILRLNQDLESRVKERTKELEKLLETLSKRTVNLEIINKELDTFSYSVSHDLRAPLRHINGFVNALKKELHNSNAFENKKVIHYLEIIDDSSQKMGQLIDGLLTLSRVGRRELILNSVVLRPLVETAINLVTFSKRTENIEFKIGNLPLVKGDSILLQQVFVNLIDNAVKFSQDRYPAIIEIDSTINGTIFVRDNGIGFSMKYADKLFGAFQRLHSQKKFKGTGIGLSIVERIIHRHGGQIWAESEPGKGATFYFKIN